MLRFPLLGQRLDLLLVAATAIALMATPSVAQAASVYVINYGANTVSQYDVGPRGRLSPKTPRTVGAGNRPTGIAVSPNGKNVYVTNVIGNNVSQYTVGPGGKLFPKIPARVPTGLRPQDIAVSPDGHSVYVVNERSDNVSQYTVGRRGKLSPKTPATIRAGYGPQDVVVSPDGDSVYVRNIFNDAGAPDPCYDVHIGSISQYDVSPHGSLSAKSPHCASAWGQGSGLAISPDGQDVYMAGFFCGGSTCQSDAGESFDVGHGGVLSHSDFFYVACDGSWEVVVSPDDRSVYVTNACGRVRQYHRSPTGRLLSKFPAGVAAGSSPAGLAITPNGTSLYVANYNGDSISQYNIAARGKLSPKGPAKAPAGNQPLEVATNPPAIP